VEFTDTSVYKNFRMANLYNFTMAAKYGLRWRSA
jgi:hypothetical protein